MAATSIASSLLRRVVVAPLRLRSVSSIPNSSSSRSYVVVPRAVKQANRGAVSSNPKGARFASSKVTAADENLKSVVNSEIESIEQSDYFKQMKMEIPEKFPFEIIDNPGDQSIILKREFMGETIKATVFSDFEETPEDYEDEEEEDEEEEGDEDDEEEGGRQSLSVVVTVQKGEGPFLEFICNFNEEGYVIDSLMMRKEGSQGVEENAYQGPEFADLDEGLQESLRRYLEVRGIRHSLYNFLTEYMMNKEEREYLGWLKNMKSFMSK